MINVGVERYVIILAGDRRNMPATRMLRLNSHRVYIFNVLENLLYCLGKDLARKVHGEREKRRKKKERGNLDAS